jgi:hypothetical protein
VANKRIEEETAVKRLEMRIDCELQDIVGEYKDEISLLNEIGGRFF